MCGKDPRDKAGAGDLALVGEVAAVEAERRGAPQVAPPGGEGLRAGGILDGEEGDDLAENGVGESADAIDAAAAAAATDSSFLAGAERRRRPLRLGMGRFRRHCRRWSRLSWWRLESLRSPPGVAPGRPPLSSCWRRESAPPSPALLAVAEAGEPQLPRRMDRRTLQQTGLESTFGPWVPGPLNPNTD